MRQELLTICVKNQRGDTHYPPHTYEFATENNERKNDLLESTQHACNTTETSRITNVLRECMRPQQHFLLNLVRIVQTSIP